VSVHVTIEPSVARKRSTPESVARARELRAQITDPGPVMEAAAAFVAVRQRSIDETTKRLVRLGYPPVVVDEVVTRLIEMHYLDDEEFARAWVESRDRGRPRGGSALRRELALKGVSREIVDEVMARRDQSAGAKDADLSAAGVLLGRKRTSLDREPDLYRRRQKAYALLARNGFDPETCRVAINAALSARS
jgi:regulatory protein